MGVGLEYHETISRDIARSGHMSLEAHSARGSGFPINQSTSQDIGLCHSNHSFRSLIRVVSTRTSFGGLI